VEQIRRQETAWVSFYVFPFLRGIHFASGWRGTLSFVIQARYVSVSFETVDKRYTTAADTDRIRIENITRLLSGVRRRSRR
jgi:hypothetical protein